MRILFTRPSLNAATNIHRIRLGDTDRFLDILGGQATREKYLPYKPGASYQPPIESPAGSAELTPVEGVKQQGIRLRKSG